MRSDIPAAASACPFHSAAQPAGTCPVSPRAAAFDPFSDDYQQDPPAYLDWSRKDEPVFFSPKLGYWVVTRYEDVKAVFRDNRTFSPSIALEKITPTVPEANEVLASYGYAMNRTLVNEDEPAHMARRRLLLEPFTPAALAVHEPLVRRLAKDYVDGFIDEGRADLVDQMLWEATLTVALHFLGVPEEDMDLLRRYSIAHTVNTWGRPSPQEQIDVAHAVGNFWKFAGIVLEKMRQDPERPGWMPFGIRMQKEHPEIVTDSYLHSMMMAGIVAAHETTANATANAMKLLLQNPAVWQELCEDPSLIPNAVEECLRHNGSQAAWRRLATCDTSVGGVPIPAGAKLLIVSSSANHDERHFLDPERVDVRRENAGDQLTFGYGSHQCMGKNLARMEMQIFLEEFTRRLPHMKLAPQRFSYVPNTSFRGPEHLWVQWNPAENPERRDPSRLQSRPMPVPGLETRQSGTRSLQVAELVHETDRVLRLKLRTSDGQPLPSWTPGAHIDIECESSDGKARQYSLCGDPQAADTYEVAILREDEGRGGSAWLHAHARAGTSLKIRGPRNHFRLDTAAPRLVLIAGGIGITPIMAMADDARRRGIDYELHYAGKTREAMPMLQALQALHGARLVLHTSSEGRRLDLAELLREATPGTKVYACGPARLLEGVEQASSHWPEDAVHMERFSAEGAKASAEDMQPFEVELRDSCTVLQVPAGQTLLAALREANIDIQSDCEEGLCGSCEARVIEGEVDHRDHVLTAGERACHDRMMTCCSRAKNGRLVLGL